MAFGDQPSPSTEEVTEEVKPEKKVRPKFESVVPLKQPMPADQAVNLLADYHGVDREIVLDNFVNLKHNLQDTVDFIESSNGGTRCILMRGKSWNHPIDPTFGKPMSRVG